MLSKQAQVNRVREFFGDIAANIVKAILDEKICGQDDEIMVDLSSGIKVIKILDTATSSPEGFCKQITVKNGVAIGIFVDGKEPKYHLNRPEENK